MKVIVAVVGNQPRMSEAAVAEFAWSLFDHLDDVPYGAGAVIAAYMSLSKENHDLVKAFVTRQEALEEAGYPCEDRPNSRAQRSADLCGND